MGADIVQISVATLASGPEGHTLSMTTTDQVTVKFQLDDLAVSLLSMTLSPVIKDAKRRLEANEKPLIFAKPESA